MFCWFVFGSGGLANSVVVGDGCRDVGGQEYLQRQLLFCRCFYQYRYNKKRVSLLHALVIVLQLPIVAVG